MREKILLFVGAGPEAIQRAPLAGALQAQQRPWPGQALPGIEPDFGLDCRPPGQDGCASIRAAWRGLKPVLKRWRTGFSSSPPPAGPACCAKARRQTRVM